MSFLVIIIIINVHFFLSVIIISISISIKPIIIMTYNYYLSVTIVVIIIIIRLIIIIIIIITVTIILIISLYYILFFHNFCLLLLFQVAWCVARASNSGSMFPLVYYRIVVNEGNAWNPDTNTVTIPNTGYYLVHYGAGVPAGTRVYHRLYSSGTLVTDLYRYSRVHNGVDTVGKTVIRRFTGSSVLKIRTYHNTFSNSRLQTTFMGLLLYEG